MDIEMINRLSDILMKHNPQTKIGAAIVAVEVVTAMREPTDYMQNKYFELNHNSGTFDVSIWERSIDAIIGE